MVDIEVYGQYSDVVTSRLTYSGEDGDFSMSSAFLVTLIREEGWRSPLYYLEKAGLSALSTAKKCSTQEGLVPAVFRRGDFEDSAWCLPGAMGALPGGVPLLTISSSSNALSLAEEAVSEGDIEGAIGHMNDAIPRWIITTSTLGRDGSATELVSAPLDEDGFRSLARTLRDTPQDAWSTMGALTEHDPLTNVRMEAMSALLPKITSAFDALADLPSISELQWWRFSNLDELSFYRLLMVDPRLCRFVELPGVVVMFGQGRATDEARLREIQKQVGVTRLRWAGAFSPLIARGMGAHLKRLGVASFPSEQPFAIGERLSGGWFSQTWRVAAWDADSTAGRMGVADPTPLSLEEWRLLRGS